MEGLMRSVGRCVALVLAAFVALAPCHPQGGPAPEGSWADLAFVQGKWDAAREKVREGADELSHLLLLTKPRPEGLQLKPSALPGAGLRLQLGNNQPWLIHNYFGTHYLADRWEAWCLRNAFAGRKAWEVDAVLQYLLTEMPHIGDYHEHLKRTQADLSELYACALAQAAPGVRPDLMECLRKAPPAGWLVVGRGRKLKQADLDAHADTSDKPVVLLPGADLGYQRQQIFRIPMGVNLWLPRGLHSKPPKGAWVRAFGRLLTYGDGEGKVGDGAGKVRFAPKNGKQPKEGGRWWIGLRFAERRNQPRTTWLQDWQVEGAEVGLQVNQSMRTMTLHRCEVSGCEVGLGKPLRPGAPPSPSHPPQEAWARLWIEECTFTDNAAFGVAVADFAHLLHTTIKECGVGLLCGHTYGNARIIECEIVDCDTPVQSHNNTVHDEIRSTTLLPRNLQNPRLRVHSFRGVLLEGNFYGENGFQPGFVKFVGVDDPKNPFVAPVDPKPLARKPIRQVLK